MLNSDKRNITRYVITYEIKDQVRQYFDGMYFSEVLADASKFGTRSQALDCIKSMPNRFPSGSKLIHVRKVML